MWAQVAGALAEAGVGLEEITKRVSAVAQAMGECWPRDLEGEGGRSRLTLGLTRCKFPLTFQVIPQERREGLPGAVPGDW